MSNLNPRQQAAVNHIDGPLLVLAGAGSGKTRVITAKIAHLINRCAIDPGRITAVTFTNKAAREMKQRVGRMIGTDGGARPSISTFHTLGLNILRREVKRLGYKTGFSIFDQQDSDTLLKELLRNQELEDESQLNALQWTISNWKNDLVSPEQALHTAEDELQRRKAHLYAAYQRSLQAYNAVDFDDLILLPVSLFRQHPDALEQWQNRIHYLLVDEYQDTNQAQYELVKLLVGVRAAFTVVGDDDQSIYAWRGARPENLGRLQSDYPRLKLIKLEQNYRSSGRILRSANQLIGNNPHLFDKRLWSDLGPGPQLRVLECRSEEQEAEKVVSEIIHLKFTAKAANSDFAILYRGNHQARPFEKALRSHNIPYFLSGGTSFFARAEIKDVMAYLRLLANPDDDSAFLRIVNTPRREIGPNTLEKLGAYASRRGIALLPGCRELGLQSLLNPRAHERLSRFAKLMEAHAREAEASPVETVQRLIREIEYEDWIRENSSSDSLAERRMENVNDLLEWIKALYHGELQEKSLAEMVNHLTLMDLLERQNEEEALDQVHLMTLHSAKGLEFPHVFLVGMEEELLPHRSSIEEENIEEERRLAYVGITRAQRSLTLTYAAKRKRFGEMVPCEPSRFLQELPEEELSWEGRDSQLSKEEKQQRGTAHLANLKSLLS
ncbi:MAG: DNA helicase Rep [Candidatus Thiodiazotropha sp. (ex Ctena orbiculata)]|nr:DNA helicase Rep [Candidatus Thiodiazotropha taylori]MBT2996357.1 DNA helicase Rep [Candidatus Thiodiazotropha taylori]MBT3000209.1 DNA helicase Rep [Candidatus Thiodiazotropha taylori]MBT3028193.1 DNA helicase Rep [Candidatus Thiodiazotropha taylori]MBT3036025.1 DNA helicase Rep [Candidatus Thiodiazotropha taylori]